MNIMFELQSDSLERVKTLKDIFPTAKTKEIHSLSGDELLQIIIPITPTVIAAIAGSSVLKEWIKSKIIKVKIHGIEYEGRPEKLPDELRQAFLEEVKNENGKAKK